jgi:transcriptional regulator with XRE-family HTH domain
MNYYKIKTELEKRKISIKDFCRQIDVTEQGLYQMLRNESMKVDVLERISAALNVQVSFWFDDSEITANEQINESPKTGKTISAKQIDLVTNELNKLLKGLNKSQK